MKLLPSLVLFESKKLTLTKASEASAVAVDFGSFMASYMSHLGAFRQILFG